MEDFVVTNSPASDSGLNTLDIVAVVAYFALILGVGLSVSEKVCFEAMTLRPCFFFVGHVLPTPQKHRQWLLFGRTSYVVAAREFMPPRVNVFTTSER